MLWFATGMSYQGCDGGANVLLCSGFLMWVAQLHGSHQLCGRNSCGVGQLPERFWVPQGPDYIQGQSGQLVKQIKEQAYVLLPLLHWAPRLQQYSHGKLHTGHNRATPPQQRTVFSDHGGDAERVQLPKSFWVPQVQSTCRAHCLGMSVMHPCT
jgi:hypothetical protein